MFARLRIAKLRMDANYMLMFQFGQRLPFAQAPAFRHFERDSSIERQFMGEIDDSKGAFAELP